MSLITASIWMRVHNIPFDIQNVVMEYACSRSWIPVWDNGGKVFWRLNRGVFRNMERCLAFQCLHPPIFHAIEIDHDIRYESARSCLLAIRDSSFSKFDGEATEGRLVGKYRQYVYYTEYIVFPLHITPRAEYLWLEFNDENKDEVVPLSPFRRSSLVHSYTHSGNHTPTLYSYDGMFHYSVGHGEYVNNRGLQLHSGSRHHNDFQPYPTNYCNINTPIEQFHFIENNTLALFLVEPSGYWVWDVSSELFDWYYGEDI